MLVAAVVAEPQRAVRELERAGAHVFHTDASAGETPRRADFVAPRFRPRPARRRRARSSTRAAPCATAGGARERARRTQAASATSHDADHALPSAKPATKPTAHALQRYSARNRNEFAAPLSNASLTSCGALSFLRVKQRPRSGGAFGRRAARRRTSRRAAAARRWRLGSNLLRRQHLRVGRVGLRAARVPRRVLRADGTFLSACGSAFGRTWTRPLSKCG